MQGYLSLQTWLEVLRSMSPIEGLLHVGAGKGGDASRYVDWGVKQAIFVEADEDFASALAAVVGMQPNWHAVTALVHDRDEEQDFYLASNHDQSGVLHPERFSGVWRNLKVTDQRRIKAVTLDGILAASAAGVAPNWAVIDCLPVLPILRGAPESLEQWDVIVARVLLDEEQISGVGAGKAELDAYLVGKGFCCMAWQEDMQPAIGQAVYVRDWKAVTAMQLDALRVRMEAQARSHAQSLQELATARDEQVALVATAKEEQTKYAAEYQARIEKLAQARDAEARTVLERQQYVEHLSKERDALLDAVSAAQVQLGEQKKAITEKDRLAGERLKEIERLTKVQEEQDKLIAGHGARIEDLTKARDEQIRIAAESRQHTEQLSKLCDEQVRIANEARTQSEEASQALIAATQLAEQRRLETTKLVKTLDEQKASASNLHAQVEQLGKERNEQHKLAAEYQKKNDQLAKDCDEQKRLAQSLQEKIQRLIEENQQCVRQAGERQLQLEALSKSLDQQKTKTTDLQSQLERTSKKNEDLDCQVTQYQKQVEQLSQERDEKEKLVLKRQVALDMAITENAKQIAKLPELLKAQEVRLEKLESNLKSHYGKSIENSTSQLESFIGIQTYLTCDQLLPTFHGWPVSPDFALYLIRLIEANNYDLILEFGSGVTTLLMAQSLQRKLQRNRVGGVALQGRRLDHSAEQDRLDKTENINSHAAAVRENILPSLVDLLSRIVTFEHDRNYYEETLDSLKKMGLEEYVELNYTPLRVHITEDEEQVLYYSCEEKIAELAQLQGVRSGKILILVDGPPASTAKHARYPALPIVLQRFAAHKFDVLLDDFNRKEEKEIVERWVQLLEKRSLACEKISLAFEKGACLLSIG